MARREHDREDLLAEATALVERVSLRTAEHAELVVGFRRQGSASFYFGAEPVYQFNTAGELRRAMVDGLMLKAEAGRLVGLRRHRTSRAVEMQRMALDAGAEQDLLRAARNHLDALRAGIVCGNLTLLGQVPPGAPLLPRIADWLDAFSGPIRIADSPGVA